MWANASGTAPCPALLLSLCAMKTNDLWSSMCPSNSRLCCCLNSFGGRCWEREGDAPLWEGDYIHIGHLSSARAERAQMLNWAAGPFSSLAWDQHCRLRLPFAGFSFSRLWLAAAAVLGHLYHLTPSYQCVTQKKTKYAMRKRTPLNMLTQDEWRESLSLPSVTELQSKSVGKLQAKLSGVCLGRTHRFENWSLGLGI